MPKASGIRARLIEVGVIVGSILLAFAVDAVWDARGEARDEAAVLEAIRSDMRSNLQRIDSHFVRREQVSARLDLFLESTPTALAALSPDSAVSLLGGLTASGPFTPSGGALRTSNLSLLDDVELRSLLGAWQSMAEGVVEDAPFLTSGALEIERLSGLAGGPRVTCPQLRYHSLC